MSVRPIQADDVRSAAEAASRFTLRGVVTAEALGLAAAKQGDTQAAQKPSPPTGAGVLKFSLGPRNPEPVAKPSVLPSMPPTAIFKGTPQKTESAEVMRLTAYVDDLSKRLRDTGAKLKTHETALARSNQALAAERHTAQQKLGAMKAELDSAHETEAKLRSELGAVTAKQQVSKENKEFLSSVRSAIATDAIEESKLTAAKELETRLEVMRDQQMQLEAHLAALSLDKTTAEQELSAANEVVKATQQKTIALTEKMAAQEERLVAMSALAPDAPTTASQDVATGDLLMMEVQEAVDAVDAVDAVARVETECCADDSGPQDMELAEDEENSDLAAEQLASPFMRFAPLSHVCEPSITGAPPKRVACPRLAARTMAHANRILPGAYIGQHFNLDAPVHLCNHHVEIDENGDVAGAAGDAGMSALIAAIVEDIRSVLEDSKMEIQTVEAAFQEEPKPLFTADE